MCRPPQVEPEARAGVTRGERHVPLIERADVAEGEGLHDCPRSRGSWIEKEAPVLKSTDEGYLLLKRLRGPEAIQTPFLAIVPVAAQLFVGRPGVSWRELCRADRPRETLVLG